MSILGLEVLTALSALFFFLAAPPYVIDTLSGRTKPERTTWLIWSVLGVIAFIGQLLLGATWSLAFTGFDTAGCIFVLLLSIRYGVGGWTTSDRLALAAAVVGVAIAVAARSPLIAVLGVMLADVAGTVLTVYKAYKQPETETTFSWLLMGTGALCGVFSVRSWSFGLLAYPVYLTIVNYAVPVAQMFGHMRRRAQE